MRMQSLRVARFAMGTRFEFLLWGEEEVRMRAAAEEALDEIDRLERQLSLFRPDSNITRINRDAAHQPVKVEPRLFALLERCQKLWRETGGVFDITVGPLMKYWGFRGDPGNGASSELDFDEVRGSVGAEHLVLDAGVRTVEFAREKMAIDLGSIAKGWALDQAIEIIAESGIRHALLHGGTSSARALGNAPDRDAPGWTIAIRPPPPELLPNGQPWNGNYVETVTLRDEALSVSGIAGRYIERDGQLIGHVLDPRSGRPVDRALLAAAVMQDAATSDALSTALLAGGPQLYEECGAENNSAWARCRSLVLVKDGTGETASLALERRNFA